MNGTNISSLSTAREKVYISGDKHLPKESLKRYHQSWTTFIQQHRVVRSLLCRDKKRQVPTQPVWLGFNGILLSYKNLRVLQNIGAVRNDNADIHFQIQADYFIFRPYVGATLRGIVNKKSITHLGILVHRVFNVVIPRPTDEPGNKWIGSSIKECQEVVFRIVVLDLFGALPYIRGELDESWIKQLTDVDEDGVDARVTESLNVSYIQFDKTKPYLHKHTIGDGLLHSPVKNQQKNGTKTPNKNMMNNSAMSNHNNYNNLQVINGKSSSAKAKLFESDLNVTEKCKSKLQSKTLDSDATDSTTKPTKKHKKEM